MQADAVADDFDDAETATANEAGRTQALADEPGVRRHEGLGEVFAALFVREDRGKVLARGQQAAAGQGEVDRAHERGGHADPREFEHAHFRDAALGEDAVDDEVSAGADEGAGAAEHRGVGKRDQKLGRRQRHAAGERDHDGDKDDDDRGIVDPGRDEGHQHDQQKNH